MKLREGSLAALLDNNLSAACKQEVKLSLLSRTRASPCEVEEEMPRLRGPRGQAAGVLLQEVTRHNIAVIADCKILFQLENDPEWKYLQEIQEYM